MKRKNFKNLTPEEKIYKCVFGGDFPLENMPEDYKQTVEQVLRTLDKREEIVVKKHYYDNLSFRKIADYLGVSASRTDQIYRKAICKLKHPSRNRLLFTGLKKKEELNIQTAICEHETTMNPYSGYTFIGDAISDILQCGLPNRLYNALRRYGISNIINLNGMTRSDIIKIKNIGEKGCDEIYKFFKKHNSVTGTKDNYTISIPMNALK